MSILDTLTGKNKVKKPAKDLAKRMEGNVKENAKEKKEDPIEVGRQLGKDILGPEGLRTEEMKDVMERRKKQADEGISPEQKEAMKGKIAKQMMAAEQQAGLKLGSALGGMTGSSAAAQARSLQAQGLQARGGIERDIFLAQEQAKQEGLDALEQTVQFDVGQIGKEAALEATTSLGLAGIEATKEGSFLAAQALKSQGGGKK